MTAAARLTNGPLLGPKQRSALGCAAVKAKDETYATNAKHNRIMKNVRDVM